MIEEWRTIKGFPEYEVSNLGNVKTRKCGRDRLMIPVQASKRYYVLTLRESNKASRKYIHRLVAENFLNVPENMVVNHKDGNHLNNRLENLEIITPRENTAHYYKNHYKGKNKPVGYSIIQGRIYGVITIEGKTYYLGRHETIESAQAAYARVCKFMGFENKYVPVEAI